MLKVIRYISHELAHPTGVAAALGQTLGFFYERSQADSSLQGAGARESREEVDRTYRRPALAYLREAAADPGSSPYLTAHIANYETRYPAAHAEARRS